MKETGLIIFTKNFEMENVKTRLALQLGKERALEVYRELVELTAEVTKKWRGEKYVFWDRFIPEEQTPFGKGFQNRIQKGEDLGQRMENAFTDVLQYHSQVCIIGTDCPYLELEILEKAFQSLRDYDFCIGPAYDGGYYLLGMKSNPAIWFREMEWSNSKVYSKTMEKARTAGLKGYILQTLRDVDTLEDYLFWRGESTI